MQVPTKSWIFHSQIKARFCVLHVTGLITSKKWAQMLQKNQLALLKSSWGVQLDAINYRCNSGLGIIESRSGVFLHLKWYHLSDHVTEWRKIICSWKQNIRSCNLLENKIGYVGCRESNAKRKCFSSYTFCLWTDWVVMIYMLSSFTSLLVPLSSSLNEGSLSGRKENGRAEQSFQTFKRIQLFKLFN